jgi:RNA polymerase sigma factor (sigma-70 family)
LQFLAISGRYTLLTKEQEIELGRRIQRWLTHPKPVPKGIERSGRRARDQFVLSNLRLVTKIAKSYTLRLAGTGLTFEDLLQEGVLGLQRAAEKYDSECGYAYSTYATWWVRQALSRAIEMKGGVVHISSEARRKLRRYEQAREDGMDHEEAMAKWELKERDVFTMRQAAMCRHVVALDALDIQDTI